MDLQPSGCGAEPGQGHGTVLMRKRERICKAEELEALEPDEPREAIALEHNRRRLFAEITALRAQQEALAGEMAESRAQMEEAQRSSEQRLEMIVSSRRWRATAPLRLAADRLRRARLRHPRG